MGQNPTFFHCATNSDDAASDDRVSDDQPRKRRGAGDGIRTRDPELGKLVLYQLSYTRNPCTVAS